MEQFVSYGQNLEDVMLWRALQGVSKGFYIDIGANHPTCDSVTKAFYDRGWTGINIEPVRSLHERLVAERPRDINLCVAVSAEKGSQPFYEVLETGLSTLDQGIAEQHATSGHRIARYEVQVLRMADIFEAHDVGEVHFLKIDVEGAERSVLSGMPFDRVQPWIVIVEATRPNSRMPTHQEWESLIVRHGYIDVYFDGVNRYYLSEQHRELAAAFLTPPNVFDDFVAYPHKLLLEDLAGHKADLAAHKTLIARMQGSWSWRLTRPLRAARALLQALLKTRGGERDD